MHPICNYNSVKKNRLFKKRIKIVQENHKEALFQLRKKKPIRCVFLALFDSVWKYDNLYLLMEKDDRFEPIILVCPVVNHGEANMIKNMRDCFSFFSKKGYNVINSYDEVSKEYVDLRHEISPDIIFYTNPYKGLIDDRYYIDQFDDLLTIYVSYNYGNSKDFNTFFVTAAAIENCDLIISSDNVILNIAGVMNKKTFGLFNYYNDHRWFDLTGDDVVYYKSVKPFVNTEMDDWEQTLDKVVNEIKNLKENI